MVSPENQPQWMIELQKIDWHALHHDYGPATNLPMLIYRTMVGPPSDSMEALGELRNCINQTDEAICPATGPVVPFLIEALRTPQATPILQLALLRLLTSIAGSTGDWGAEDPVDGPFEIWPGLSYRDIFAAVWRGSEVYVDLIQRSTDADVRMKAIHILAVLAEQGPACVPADVRVGLDSVIDLLLGCVRQEPDYLALACVAAALGRILPLDARVRPVLQELLERSDDVAVRIAAALQLVNADHERHEQLAAVDLLIDTLMRVQETDGLFHPTEQGRLRVSPWIGGRLRFRLRRALCEWSAADEVRMAKVFPALLVGIQMANEHTVDLDVGPVLSWLWPGRHIRAYQGVDGQWQRELPPPVTREELTALRRAALEACCNNPRLWNHRSTNAALAFKHVGLPYSAAAVRSLLACP